LLGGSDITIRHNTQNNTAHKTTQAIKDAPHKMNTKQIRLEWKDSVSGRIHPTGRSSIGQPWFIEFVTIICQHVLKLKVAYEINISLRPVNFNILLFFGMSSENMPDMPESFLPHYTLVAQCHAACLGANGGHFEYLQ
jgi:hypothetical protein